jgi:hypothetical protein
MSVSSGNAEKGRIGLKYDIEWLHEHDDMCLKLCQAACSDLRGELVRCRYADSPTVSLGKHQTGVEDLDDYFEFAVAIPREQKSEIPSRTAFRSPGFFGQLNIKGSDGQAHTFADGIQIGIY